MKKALLATTALVLSAGVAAADVKISGYGRTGIIYYEDANTLAGTKDTQVSSRLRMNIDASTETDAGVEFGARFRLQWNQGESDTNSNPAKIWVRAQGLTVEVGNVDTAMDSAGLIYAHDLGSYDRSGAFDTAVGLSANAGNFYAYSAQSYGAEPNRLGVAATYSFGDLTVRGSYVTPDQTNDLPLGTEKELGVSVDYKWDNRLELSAAYTNNAGGNDGEDLFFLGARYAVLDNARIGLSYFNADDTPVAGSVENFGQTFALYGDYTLADGLTNIEAYVANNNGDWEDAGKETDVAFGLGVNYDLGGARLGASIHRDYRELVSADVGVRFEF